MIDELGRLNDVFGRLGLTEGVRLGENDLGWLGVRLNVPLLGTLGLGADRVIADGPRFICGLGLELNDREGICGETGALGVAPLTFCREAELRESERPRDCPRACDPISRATPTTTAISARPLTFAKRLTMHHFAHEDPHPPARERFLLL